MFVSTTLIGRLAADPELKFTGDGTAVCSFTVVTSRRHNLGNGQWEDRDVTYWKCAAFREAAENIDSQFRKGDAVVVYGQLSEHTWEDPKDGGKRSRIELRVDAAGHDYRWGVPK